MKKYLITQEATLLGCLAVIDAGVAGIAVVVDEEHRLIGTMSDGDVRRALVDGHALSSPILPFVTRDCFSVSTSVTRAEVLDLMKARRFSQVPIVDESNRVVGLHLMHDILGAQERPNWAVIMAGGRGKRLLPITEYLPKPMVPVAGRPILERVVLHLVGYGIRRIFLSVNYLSHIIEDHFGDGTSLGCRIEYLREDEPLGTGGALSLLPDMVSDPVFVMNGDLVAEPDVGAMLEWHSRRDYYATMGVRSYYHEVPFGCLSIDEGRILNIEEKPLVQKTVNAGIYVLSPEAILDVPKHAHFPITDLFDQALNQHLPCGAFDLECDWLDIGRPQQLASARGEA